MVDTNKFVFSFLKKKDINVLQNYIHKNWKSNHILSSSKKLLIWQHLKKNKKLNFFVCKHNRDIIAVLGIINFYNKNYKNKKIGLGIWTANIKYKNIGGVLFLKFLEKNKNEKILATGLNKLSIKYYEFFNFKIRNLSKYYICPLEKKKQAISKNLIVSKPSKENNIKIYTFKNFYKNLKNHNEIIYVKERFEKHPIYKHFILKDQRYDLWFIGRSVKINNLKFLRILDYYGDFKSKKLNQSFARFCINEKYHHVEFMHYGDDKNDILKSGFKKVYDKKNTLPILSEPYLGLKNSNIRIAFKNFKKVKIVKGDVDADRPNII